jgi:ABC-type transport system involved in multi-copper enzyme maturation permease subunit
LRLKAFFSTADWAHAGTTIALWMVLPLVIAAWRFARRDVN